MKTNPNLFFLSFLIFLFSFSHKAFAIGELQDIDIDYDNPPNFSVTIFYQQYGPIVISGQTKVFGASIINKTGSTKVCDFRFAAFQNSKLVQIYEGTEEITILNNGSYDIKLPCFIELPEGDYTFYPVVRFSGESKWYILGAWVDLFEEPYMSFWKLHVYDEYLAPSSEYMNLPGANGKGDSEYSVYHFYQNQKFSLQMKLVNNTPKELNGRLKIVWERNLSKFWRGMEYSVSDITTEWKHSASDFAYIGSSPAVNGGIPISIGANSKLDILIKDCSLHDYYDYGMRWAPYLVAYFLPEGKEDIDSNWLLINDNSDFCFDTNMHLLTDKWDHALNFLPFSTFKGNATGTENLKVPNVRLNFTKANGIISLSNVPESSFVRVVDLNGRLIQTEFSSSNNSFSFTLGAGSGLNVISLYNYDGSLVKSFKIIR